MKTLRTATSRGYGGITLQAAAQAVDLAMREGMDEESIVKIDFDESRYRDVMSITDTEGDVVTLAEHDRRIGSDVRAVPMSSKRHVSLGFLKSTDARMPIQALLNIQDEAWTTLSSVVLNAEELAKLLSGGIVTVEAQV